VSGDEKTKSRLSVYVPVVAVLVATVVTMGSSTCDSPTP
jgi:hypothetical protein